MALLKVAPFLPIKLTPYIPLMLVLCSPIKLALCCKAAERTPTFEGAVGVDTMVCPERISNMKKCEAVICV